MESTIENINSPVKTQKQKNNKKIQQLLNSLNDKQLEAVKYNDSPLLILAGVGTGKTQTLMSKYAHLI